MHGGRGSVWGALEKRLRPGVRDTISHIIAPQEISGERCSGASVEGVLGHRSVR